MRIVPMPDTSVGLFASDWALIGQGKTDPAATAGGARSLVPRLSSRPTLTPPIAGNQPLNVAQNGNRIAFDRVKKSPE
jgi:hypothetical protein